ncbi:MAG: Coenzyme F420 hydrogenase/dehydrogenase, beta subunit C-terminal domain [Lachnospiraceae bacterium]|nr:Coenzyme F420 hydrogenase/dehydrogenase, beta subunit C-terminal domain [Lachnospiraceae bacterium]MBR4604608.1 Coenzyme F420 hydrogenase/dehydrogenase, beta subunit C-terminal domain [Lachnospiraceae bacterium]
MIETLLKDDISKCCGCFACKDVCPKGAIKTVADEEGFLYPEIDAEKCVSCGLCSKVCAYNKGNTGNRPEKVYAAASKDDVLLMKVASGGMFTVMAKSFIKSGGIVCGSAMFRTKNGFEVKHVFVEKEEELALLAGSKYVKSSTDGVFKGAKEILSAGKKLLFSGTPCQIAALKSFLGRDYDELITVDIICHGVPSQKFFNDHIKFYEKKHSCTVTDFRFRDKSRGQGMNYCITEENGNGTRRKVKNGKLNSFFGLFLKGSVYRKNCYSCPYASEKRVSDITIGDYWGVYLEHAGEVRKAKLDNQKGISCVLVNTDKGSGFWETISADFHYLESDFRKVAAHNDQLVKPSVEPADRETVLDAYKNDGYKAVDDIYGNEIKLKKFVYLLEFYIPKSVKRNLMIALSGFKKLGRK